MSEISIADAMRDAGVETGNPEKPLAGRIYYSVIDGPFEYHGATKAKPQPNEKAFKGKLLFSDQFILLRRNEFKRPMETEALIEAITSLQTWPEEKPNLSFASRSMAFASADFPTIACITRALHQIKKRDNLSDADYRKGLDLVAKTFAGRAVVTRRSIGKPLATLEERLPYLKRAQSLVEKMIAGQARNITIQHFYDLSLPFSVVAPASVMKAAPAAMVDHQATVALPPPAAPAPITPTPPVKDSPSKSGDSIVPWVHTRKPAGIREPSRPPEGGSWSYPNYHGKPQCPSDDPQL